MTTTSNLAAQWDERFSKGKQPWDTGRPCRELQRVLEEARINPCRTLELGCGTGTNAIFLTEHGFDVTAVDASEVALEKAQARANQAGVFVRFIHADVLGLPDLGPPFAFVLDRGCYQHVRTVNRQGFRQLLASVTEPGSLYLVMVPNANETDAHLRQPGALYDYEICLELAHFLYTLVHLREYRIDGNERDGALFCPLFWSALLRRTDAAKN